MKRTKEFRGVFTTSSKILDKVLVFAEMINNSAKTGTGFTSVESLPEDEEEEKEAKELLAKIQVKAEFRKKGEFNLSKIKKLVKVEKSFFKELSETAEAKKVVQLPDKLKYTYLKYILNKYALGMATKESILNLAECMELNVVCPTFDDSETIFAREIASILHLNENDVISCTLEKKVVGGAPTAFIKKAVHNLNKKADKIYPAFVAVENPSAEDWAEFALKSPYQGSKRTDVLLRTDKRNIHFEFFGWTNSINYDRKIVEKAKDIANIFEHQFAVFSPKKARTEEKAIAFMEKIWNEYPDKENLSELEKKTVEWILTHDNIVGETDVDAIYNGFYACLEELGVAKKLMPVSKLDLFK